MIVPGTALAQTDAVRSPARLAAVRASGLLDTGAEEPFDRLARLAATLLDTPMAFITVVDAERSFWKSTVGIEADVLAERQRPVEQSFCQHVVEARTEVVIDDARADVRTRDNATIVETGRAWAGFPLLAPNGEVLGSFCVVDAEPRAWTERDREVLRVLTFAASGEVALRVQAEEFRLLADTLQKSLLPAFLPEVPGLEVGAFHHAGGSGTEVVGDFYDLFERGEGQWNAVVGDVCGKGVAAASVTALARHTIRAAATTAGSPSGVLTALNHALLEQQPHGGTFLTAVLVRLTPADEGVRAIVSSGGHVPVLLRRADGSVEPVGATGTLLGAFDDVVLHDTELLLAPGDALVLYTDGITEALAAEGRERFGEERLHEVLGGPASSAEELATRIDAAVTAFGGSYPADDMAVVVVRVPPAYPTA